MPSSDSKAGRLMVQLAAAPELPHYGVPENIFSHSSHGKSFLQPQMWGKKGNPTSFLASWHIIEAHRRLVYNAVISMAILWLRVLQNFMDSACF